ncbi:MAG TPA: DinB family protein [Vicinamibacterales bacterium]
MFRTIDDFEKAWANEREGSLKLMRALTDASLGQLVAPGGRTLGRIAWHIVQTLGEMGGHAGLKVEGANEKTPQPAAAAAFAAAYAANAEALASAVKASWKDSDLPGEIEMYGQKWTRGQTLWGLIAHEVHHRGQMTVLMRQAGIKVPGVYGPAKEEWAAYGMPVQD